MGFALGSVLFIHRMSRAVAVETDVPFVSEDVADDGRGYDEAKAADPGIVIYRITGAFFFGAAASIGSVLDRISDTHRALVVDFSAVPFLDSTGANVIEGLARNAAKRGVRLYLSGTSPDIRRALEAHGVHAPEVVLAASVEAALRMEREAAAG